MAKITRIKAKDTAKKHSDSSKNVKDTKTVASSKAKAVTSALASDKAVKPTVQKTKSSKKPFILARPFIALGNYLRGSWQELRQVRWPTRKATWKLFFAVVIYTAIFMVFITLLDLFFSWLFNLILNR